jgi:cytochrome P450
MSVEQDLAAWGNHERDAPFPLFAELRARGAVHKVTLADGHDAFLVVKHDEAKAALGDPRLSKRHADRARVGRRRRGRRVAGPTFARHMLVVDPPDHTRLRRLVAAAFSVRRIEGLREHVQRSSTISSTRSRRRDHRPKSISSPRSRSHSRSP